MTRTQSKSQRACPNKTTEHNDVEYQNYVSDLEHDLIRLIANAKFGREIVSMYAAKVI